MHRILFFFVTLKAYYRKAKQTLSNDWVKIQHWMRHEVVIYCSNFLAQIQFSCNYNFTVVAWTYIYLHEQT